MENIDSLIFVEKIGSNNNIALITLNCQKTLNTLNEEMLGLLKDALISLMNDKSVRVAIIYAEGKSWCAGADLKWMGSLVEGANKLIECGQETFALLEAAHFPVIAAINGYALGGGMELALACDIRIASEKALFGQPETTVGLAPGWGATYRLPNVVGLGIAKELILTGRKFPADEALKIGLVSAVYPPEQLRDKAVELAEQIANNAPIAVQEAKKAINKGLNTSLEEGYKAEVEGSKICFKTEDIREGIASIFEKRKPEFKGK
ncbi:MAG: enoyl-CoA hydratase/isomerase family protein [Candidatus Heimdallarchaeota archaeon]|jgi:enoyl-CoA hydratase|nr:enoyl-CoA hydratase/isomerase family protein [Candidatus Heimdallarchaeota archaeon]MCK4253272.1 enoyl-CoA hydratase/isomerase family protein [Candidatus Heimdallarchaeota archaeon]